VALLLHAGLLLLPLKPWQNDTPATPKRLTVNLLPLPAATPEATQPVPEQPEQLDPKPEPEPTPLRAAQVELAELPEKPADPPPPEPAASPESLTSLQLLELYRGSKPEEDEASPARRLGSARPYQPPANWSKNAGSPYLAEFDNRFDGMVAPEDVEIVDRWMAADGSHNVVLNLPNGDTVCGRAEAYNPLQPLVEPVMMFRDCPGGGKRTFTMPDRYHKGQ
jgi:hypothetical protein